MQGNITQIQVEDRLTSAKDVISFTAWDDKVNPVYRQAPENWLVYNLPTYMRTSSLHNRLRSMSAADQVNMH